MSDTERQSSVRSQASLQRRASLPLSDKFENGIKYMLDTRKRVELGREKGALTCNFVLWMCTSIAITISVGVFLWTKNQNGSCLAPNTYADTPVANISQWVDVYKRYTDVLKIFLTIGIVDFFRSVLMIISVQTGYAPLATIYQALVINDVLGFGAVFVLHAARFSLSGRICAGDFADQSASYPYKGQLLIDMGSILTGLVCFVWIGGVVLCGFSVVLCFCEFKPLANHLCRRIGDAWRSVSLLHRIEKKNQKDLLYIQFAFQTLQSLSIFIAVASFLWYIEPNNTCSAP